MKKQKNKKSDIRIAPETAESSPVRGNILIAGNKIVSPQKVRKYTPEDFRKSCPLDEAKKRAVPVSIGELSFAPPEYFPMRLYRRITEKIEVNDVTYDFGDPKELTNWLADYACMDRKHPEGLFFSVLPVPPPVVRTELQEVLEEGRKACRGQFEDQTSDVPDSHHFAVAAYNFLLRKLVKEAEKSDRGLSDYVLSLKELKLE